MYQVVIKFKETTPHAQREMFTTKANEAFNNRAGQAKNSSSNPDTLIYRGEDDLFSCLLLGSTMLEEVKGFKDSLSIWNWIDEDDPEESSDVLAELMSERRC